jgi:hypothetical protein
LLSFESRLVDLLVLLTLFPFNNFFKKSSRFFLESSMIFYIPSLPMLSSCILFSRGD